MQRRDIRRPDWRMNGMSYRDCSDANQRVDGDDLHQPIGYYWWNGRC
jgi:hypothetical protein